MIQEKKIVHSFSIPQFLTELKIVDGDYYRVLSISKNDLELHLKRRPNECLESKYGYPTCFQ